MNLPELNYQNKKPLATEFEILHKLLSEDRTFAKLVVDPVVYGNEVFIEIEIYNGPYDSYTSSHYYRVLKDSAIKLIDRGYVQGISKIGYIDNTNLVISSFGKDFFYAKLRKYKEDIENLFKKKNHIFAREIVKKLKISRPILVVVLNIITGVDDGYIKRNIGPRLNEEDLRRLKLTAGPNLLVRVREIAS